MHIEEAVSKVRKMAEIARGYQDTASEFAEMAAALDMVCDEVSRLQHELLVAVSMP